MPKSVPIYALALTLFLLVGAQALPTPVGRDKHHTVAPNETLNQIARQYGLAPDHIQWANDLSDRRPPKEGDDLLIPLRRIPPFTPRESTAIVLNLPERMIYLFRGGSVAKFWGVAIGADVYPTPTGDFRVLAKEKNPTWEPPKWLEKKAIPPGPDNPLGDRWMQITPDMVGIHGTNNPDSIGGVASLGCVRLYPEAIHDLYEQVTVGTPVYVIYDEMRLGQEADGTLVWSFFPDPYYKHIGTMQAQEALRVARREGNDVLVSDFEVEERMREAQGVIAPVFGKPAVVRRGEQEMKNAAFLKPTGNYLDSAVLEERGFKLRANQKTKTLEILSPEGKVALFNSQKLPLNPLRVPKVLDGPLKIEGHRWKGKAWLPFPLVLDYFEIPYSWDAKTSVLEFTD